MTTATKIHRQDPEERPGVAVCGRKAGPDRMTEDPAGVTCVVCLTFAADARVGTPRANALDRLVDAPVELVDMAAREVRSTPRAIAKIRAMEKLATRHAQEFRTIYREELAAATVLEELDLLDP